MRSSAAPSPTESATTAEHRNTKQLKVSPSRKTARYSQNMEISSDCFNASDKVGLFAIFGEELTKPVRLRLAEDLCRRPFLLNHSLVQKDDSIGDFVGETHLMRHHDHRRPVRRKLAHYPQDLLGKFRV